MPIALVAWLVALALVGVVCGAMFYVNRGRWQRTTSKRESEQQSDVGLDDFATELQLPSARR